MVSHFLPFFVFLSISSSFFFSFSLPSLFAVIFMNYCSGSIMEIDIRPNKNNIVKSQATCPAGKYNMATKNCENCNPYTCNYDCSYDNCYKCGFLWLSTCCDRVSKTCYQTCYQSCCTTSYSCENCPPGNHYAYSCYHKLTHATMGHS